MRPTPPRHGPLAAAERAGSMKAPVTGGMSPWGEGWEGQRVRASENLGCPLWVWLKMELISQPPRGAGRGGGAGRGAGCAVRTRASSPTPQNEPHSRLERGLLLLGAASSGGLGSRTEGPSAGGTEDSPSHGRGGGGEAQAGTERWQQPWCPEWEHCGETPSAGPGGAPQRALPRKPCSLGLPPLPPASVLPDVTQPGCGGAWSGPGESPLPVRSPPGAGRGVPSASILGPAGPD